MMFPPSSLDGLRCNPEWAKLPIFDRKGWKRLRFGEVVENVNETESDPVGAGVERFIGLEHLEPGSLHVRSWGNTVDGTTFTRRCRPGQVLFGKRRVYQRKVAKAEFDAVVSGDIYVFQAKKDKLLPELLPFLCMSERFFQHAIDTSAGSLSPRTSWGSVANFEFGLPPVEQQRRIAEILWAVDELNQRYKRSEKAITDSRVAIMEQHFSEDFASHSNTRQLNELADVSYGLTLGGHRATLFEQCQYLRVANVQRGLLDLAEVKTVNCTNEETRRYELVPGDVLIVEGHADPAEIGRAAVWQSSNSGMLHQNHLLRVRCHTKLLPRYLAHYMNSKKGRDYFRSRAKSSSGLHTINSTVVKEFPIPSTAVHEQQQLLLKVDRFDQACRHMQTAKADLQVLFGAILKGIML